MHYNLATRPNIRARNSVFSNIKDQCWLYRWLQVHSFILFIKAFFRPLVKQDMFNLSEEFWPETTYMEFGRIKKIYPHFSTGRIVSEMIKVDMTIACIVAFLEAGFNFAGPIIIKYILVFLNKTSPTEEERSNSYALSGLWIAFCVVQLFLKQYWIRIASLCATKTEVLLQTQFYRKTTRVTSSYKKYMHLGDFYSYWFADVTIITACIINFPLIVSAPATLILSVIFVCIQVGAYGLLLLAVIAIAVVIEILIDMNMASVFTHKLTKYELKLAENMHMYKQFRQLKQLAWQQLIIRQNVRYRAPQNSLNKVYYILGQIYLFVTNFAPVLVIFILIIVGAYSQNQVSWGTTVVFTIIGYINTIVIPLRNLPNVISRLFATFKVFQRIDNFLGAEQIRRNQNIYIEQGTVEISKLVLSVATRSSINRLIVRQSTLVEGEQSMLAHLKNMPIEVRMYHTMDFISRQQIKKFRKLMKCLECPFQLKYKRGDVVVLLGQRSGSGKTSFIRGVYGILQTQSGYLKYNGKLGLVSADDFYLQKSIKQNVIFGEHYNPDRLKRAYILSGLNQQVQKFTQKDNTIITTNPNVVAQSQRFLISLARAIYYDCDIILIDDFFHQFQIDELQILYNRICENLRDKLVFISTNMIHFLKNNDQVLILENRKVIEHGTFWKLKQNPKSKLHDFRITDLQLVHHRQLILKSQVKQQNTAIERTHSYQQSRLSSVIQRIQSDGPPIKHKRNKQKPRYSSGFKKFLSQASLKNFDEIKQTDLVRPLPLTTYPVQRPTPVEWKYYVALLRNGGWMYLFTFLFITLANGVSTFSTWLIGSLSKSPFGLSVQMVLLLYACLQISFGILLLIYGMFIPKVATLNVQRMSNQFNDLISRSKLQQFQKFSSVHLSYIFGGDNQNFYNICDNITNTFNSFVTLISTVIIMGLASSYIFVVAGVVVVYSVIVYKMYRFVAQEVFVLGGPPKRYFFRALQDSVNGTQTLQFYDKVQWYRSKVYDGIYMFSAVWRTNLRFITHSFNILCGIAQLILMAGILFLAVSKKQKFSAQATMYVNVAITASPRILGSILILFNNLANMAAQINTTIKIPYECFQNKYQPRYNTPVKPPNWPWNGKIQLRNVTLQRKQISHPFFDKINLTIESGQVIGMYSDFDNDINLLFSLLNGLISPQQNNGKYAGQVIISDINIATFGQIYATQAVVVLNSTPVCFNGSIRFNVDPFNRYTDVEIQKALQIVRFWNDMDQDQKNNNKLIQGYNTLDFIIENRGQQLPTSALQKLNFARAYLKKPKILLLQRGFSKIVQTSKSQAFYLLLLSIFRNSTIIMITINLHYLMRCDRIIGLRKGKIIEKGSPQQLATNPETRFYKMIKVLAQSQYLSKQSKTTTTN